MNRPGATGEDGTDSTLVWDTLIVPDASTNSRHHLLQMVLEYGLLEEIARFATVNYAKSDFLN